MKSGKGVGLVSRRKFLASAATALGGLTLAACGNQVPSAAGGATGATAAPAAGGGAAPATGTTVNFKWSSWGNPGETKRLDEYTKDFNKRHPNIQGQYLVVPNDSYEAKLLTGLNGGTAPDAPYVGDSTISKLIANKTILDLTSRLQGPDSKSNPKDFSEGLWGAAKSVDGKIYGVTVDCNPMVLWYNKKVLREAGINDMPAALFEQGKWNRTTFTSMLDTLRAKGKRGYVLGNWWGHYWSWITTNGGKVYDQERFVAHEDPKAIEAFQYVYDNLQSKNFLYVGGLPKGQADDALFISQQLGFVGAGRWLLPEFKTVSGLEFDIVPWPSSSGKMEPAGVPTAYMVITAATPHPNEVFTFLTEYVSKEGQTFRLQGGGNAVPSIAGADNVVIEGSLPEHARYFLDARKIGYANFATEVRVPGLSSDITDALDPLWLKGGNVKDVLTKIGEAANKKIKANGTA